MAHFAALMLFVTHHQEEIVGQVQRMLFMDHGQLSG